MKNIQDLENAQSFIHPDHPRGSGLWTQYCGLKTRLAGRIYFSDVLNPSDKWQYYDGRNAEVINVDAEQTPENYHETHNHYQTALYEVINLTPFTNAVPVWGDGTAAVHDASAWGAFFSARSVKVRPSLGENVHYGPAAIAVVKDNEPGDEFDCQLTGLEVDVLNAGKPGVFPNKAKHGITICGFGNPNSHAISIICENFDCAPDAHKGQFESGIYIQSSINPEYGRMIVADFEQAHIGLDFRKPVFRWGAMQANTQGPGTGIVFNEGSGGEFYAGPRWKDIDGPRWTSIRMAEEGLRIVSADSTQENIAIDKNGDIYLHGNVIINGEPLEDLITRKVNAALEEILKKMENK